LGEDPLFIGDADLFIKLTKECLTLKVVDTEEAHHEPKFLRHEASELFESTHNLNMPWTFF
jgi:hypothetical protein